MKYCSLLVVLATAAFIATPGFAAVSVSLDCTGDDMRSDHPGVHDLYEIDLDAATVHQHAVNDDGSPAAGSSDFTDISSPAEIGDQQVKWTENLESGAAHYVLDRYSGLLTIDTAERTTQGWRPHTVHAQCTRWSPMKRDKLF